MTEKKIPHLAFIGIGVTRGGSTWLSQNLAAHPDICLSNPKETRFFSSEKILTQDPGFYARCFLHCGQERVWGEFDPNYLNDPSAARRIAHHYPAIKLIVILRNPIDRAYSHFNTHKQKEKTWERDFGTAIRRPNNVYVNSGRYAHRLSTYYKHFSKEQFLFLMYEDIAKRPEEVLKETYTFLGVRDDFVSPYTKEHINYTGISRAKIPGINALLYKTETAFIRGSLKNFAPLLKLARVNDLVRFVKRNNIQTNLPLPQKKKEEMRPEDRAYLAEIYTDDIAKLSRMIGRDFATYWGWRS